MESRSIPSTPSTIILRSYWPVAGLATIPWDPNWSPLPPHWAAGCSIFDERQIYPPKGKGLAKGLGPVSLLPGPSPDSKRGDDDCPVPFRSGLSEPWSSLLLHLAHRPSTHPTNVVGRPCQKRVPPPGTARHLTGRPRSRTVPTLPPAPLASRPCLIATNLAVL